jgi:syntaxin 1B/2/3
LVSSLLQDSFVGEATNGQPSRQGDIEMGMQVQRSNSDLGMETFNKQVHHVFAILFILIFYAFNC